MLAAWLFFCALADAALITAGVFGMAEALNDRPQWAQALAFLGAIFLAWYGWKALQRMRNPAQLQASEGGENLSRRHAIAQAAAFTLLNPHVYLDTVVLVGSMGAQQPVGASNMVCSRRQCCQRYLVQFAGFWGPVVGTLVCTPQGMASVGRHHWPHHVLASGPDAASCGSDNLEQCSNRQSQVSRCTCIQVVVSKLLR